MINTDEKVALATMTSGDPSPGFPSKWVSKNDEPSGPSSRVGDSHYRSNQLEGKKILLGRNSHLLQEQQVYQLILMTRPVPVPSRGDLAGYLVWPR